MIGFHRKHVRTTSIGITNRHRQPSLIGTLPRKFPGERIVARVIDWLLKTNS